VHVARKAADVDVFINVNLCENDVDVCETACLCTEGARGGRGGGRGGGTSVVIRS